MTDIASTFTRLSDLLHRSFAAAAARDLDVIYQIELGDPTSSDTARYHLVVREGRLLVARGQHANPHLTLTFTDLATHIDVLTGKLDPMQAFLESRMRADGHIVLAMRMLQLFVPQYAATGPEQLR